jgi:hypothetical protein
MSLVTAVLYGKTMPGLWLYHRTAAVFFCSEDGGRNEASSAGRIVRGYADRRASRDGVRVQLSTLRATLRAYCKTNSVSSVAGHGT